MKYYRGVALLACIAAQPNAYGATTDDFWKDCPGSACPANVPDERIGSEFRGRRNYENMDKEKLQIERERLKNSIEKIDRIQERRNVR